MEAADVFDHREITWLM